MRRERRGEVRGKASCGRACRSIRYSCEDGSGMMQWSRSSGRSGRRRFDPDGRRVTQERCVGGAVLEEQQRRARCVWAGRRDEAYIEETRARDTAGSR